MSDFIAFDLHLQPDMYDVQIARVEAFQKMLKSYDRAIYGGDIRELTWFTRKECEESEEYRAFKSRLRPQDEELWGNHDWELKDELKEILVVRNIAIMHGHQFDKYATGCAQKTYYKWAPWVRGIWLKSPWEQKMAGDNSWQKHNGQVWGVAINWLEKSKYWALIVGHTHDTAIINRPITRKKLVGVGSLMEDGVFFNLDTMRVGKVQI